MRGKTLWSFYVDEAHRQINTAFSGVDSLDTWQRRRPELHRQFMASMGLDPLPPGGDLEVQTWGEFTGEGYRATRLSWNLLPDCRTTGHLYLPDPASGAHAVPQPLPGILYVCGHRPIGVLGYQHHAIAWARRGYACLVVDTIEQHDNRCDHHGLFDGDRPDWVSLGYTAAGGELWNSMRALDVLASQPQVDAERLGVTGISGGGALTLFLAIADPRIQVAASIAGVSNPAYSLQDRVLQGHCDCMYPHNRFGRDLAEYAALIAPRPLQLSFARHDALFTIEEYQGFAARVQKIYELYDAQELCPLLEYDGPHMYQPQTLEWVQKWFDQHLSKAEHPIDLRVDHEHDDAATAVFNGAPPPSDRLELLPELMSVRGRVELPRSAEAWETIRDEALARVRREVLMLVHDDVAGSAGQPWSFDRVGTWLMKDGTPKLKYRAQFGGMELMGMLLAPRPDYDQVVVTLAGPGDEIRGQCDRGRDVFGSRAAVLAVEPRGAGMTSVHPGQARHLLRAGALVGLTPTMLMIQDLWRLMPHLRALPEVAGREVYLHGRGDAAVACLYHALFDPDVAGVILEAPPVSHRDGGFMLNVLRCLDMPEAVGLMAPRKVALALEATPAREWKWTQRAYARLGQSENLALGRFLERVVDRVLA